MNKGQRFVLWLIMVTLFLSGLVLLQGCNRAAAQSRHAPVVRVPCVQYRTAANTPDIKVCTLPDGTRCALTVSDAGGVHCSWAPVVGDVE